MALSEQDAQLGAEFNIEEARRSALYDDATGKPIKRGDTVKGNITGGVGHNFMRGLDPTDILYFLNKDIADVRAKLAPYEWYQLQDPVRQNALAILCFNLGLGGLLHWPSFLHFMSIKDYPSALKQISGNAIWNKQVGSRAQRIEGMVANGIWPSQPG